MSWDKSYWLPKITESLKVSADDVEALEAERDTLKEKLGTTALSLREMTLKWMIRGKEIRDMESRLGEAQIPLNEIYAQIQRFHNGVFLGKSVFADEVLLLEDLIKKAVLAGGCGAEKKEDKKK